MYGVELLLCTLPRIDLQLGHFVTILLKLAGIVMSLGLLFLLSESKPSIPELYGCVKGISGPLKDI